MRVAVIPGKPLIAALVVGALGVLFILLFGIDLKMASWAGAIYFGLLVTAACVDYLESWRLWQPRRRN